jgi:hypothetical protein
LEHEKLISIPLGVEKFGYRKKIEKPENLTKNRNKLLDNFSGVDMPARKKIMK